MYKAGVVKLVDAEDSKSSARKGMSVRFRPPAPHKIKGLSIISDSPFFVDFGDCAHLIFQVFLERTIFRMLKISDIRQPVLYLKVTKPLRKTGRAFRTAINSL